MIKHLVRRTAGAAVDRKGVTAAEYAILAVGVIIIVGGAVAALKPQLTNVFNDIGATVSAEKAKL